jgi:hypothetical protein
LAVCIGAPAIAAFPTSWSCSDNACTGTYPNTSGGFSIGIPFWNLSPATAAFDSETQSIGEIGEFQPNAENCDIDQEAVQAGIEIKQRIDTDGIPNNTQDQTEYGAIIGQVGPDVRVGTVVQGTSYNQIPQASIDYSESWSSLRIPFAYTIGVIHSHPWHNSSSIRELNKRPSPTDWQQADGLVGEGADPSRLTLYIIDHLGVLRAYPYTPPSQRSDTVPPARAVSTACE